MIARNKNIVITGGNNGLGKAIALQLAEEKNNIFFTYCSDDKSATETVREISKLGVRVKALKVNFLNEASVKLLVEKSYEFFDGEVDVLVNNAGIICRKPLFEITEKDWDDTHNVNTKTPFFLLQQFGKKMQEKQLQRIQKAYKEKGIEITDKLLNSSAKLSLLADYCIVFITSISRNVFTGLLPYEVSKAGTHGIVGAAASDPSLSYFQIRVNEVAPGLIATNLNKHIWMHQPNLWQQRASSIPLGFTGEPADVAKAVSSIIGNKWMNGTTMTVDGGRSHNFIGSDLKQQVPVLRSKL
ncbi:hypothetical protein AYO45_02125 [Gammaproteobacteria bacterium SCGC AG-212-F23]|nr:hypothetical protein AYO45_02125 [Gammaproteobacteria bacterium SCGC AG-212-F23]